MREINLSKYQVRTDLITDVISKKKINGIEEKVKYIDSIKVSKVKVLEKATKIINKAPGIYTTIFFDDVTDTNNLEKVKQVFMNELKDLLKEEQMDKNKNILIVGLGNIKSTPDSLGPKVLEKTIVTRHIYNYIGSLESGFAITSGIVPNVMGNTGIESKDIIIGVINQVKPDFIIAIDALASDSIERVNKTIQITNTGIHPGSGIGNNRGELSKSTLNIPVIAIGIPTVVDATTIVSSTINFMVKHFSYNIKHKNSNKFVPPHLRNYLLEDNLVLNMEEKEKFLGLLGTLSSIELKSLLFEVLTPIGYNLMVTPKEIDFLIEKLVEIISYGINHSLHNVTK